MIIRRERPADAAAVGDLHVAAFTVDPVTGAVRAPDDVVEARLVDELRADPGFLPHLSLVAADGDDVVGHVMGTRGWLEPYGTPALGLGPLGVLPDRQGQGIGTALVHALLAVAEAAGERVVVLLGAPAYYRQFGFVRSTELGIEPPEASRSPACDHRVIRSRGHQRLGFKGSMQHPVKWGGVDGASADAEGVRAQVLAADR